MRLLNFSIGRVQTIQIGASAVRTAHVKAPVPEPWRITQNGAEGDQRAVHPDKLYAFARTAYEYWRAELGVDADAWPDGFFGENLTLDSLSETEIRVGDVFSLGEDVELVVSGARTPCAKLAWRLGQPRSFQKTFARSRRSGAYFDVIKPGRVRPGDVLKRVKHDPAMPSVADVCDFIDSHKTPPLDALKRLLDCEHLSPANRMLLGAKREMAERAENRREHRWRGWRRFSVASIVQEAQGIKSFQLRPLDETPLCIARPGQFVSVRLVDSENSVHTRTWSLSSYSENPDRYQISVLQQSGPGSKTMHALREGAELELRAPVGNFIYDMGSVRPPVFIAGGVGITPIMAMLEAHFFKSKRADAYLFYAAKTPEDMAFLDRIEEWRKEHSRFHVTYAFSRAKKEGAINGRISPALVKEALKDLHVFVGAKRVDLPWFEADFYLCGPDKFCNDLSDNFIEGGANPHHIYTEQFTAANPIENEVDEARVRFSRSGKEADWRSDENLTLLELAEKVGVRIDHDCRAGACLTCKTNLLKGATSANTDDGAALMCIGRPTTNIVEIDA